MLFSARDSLRNLVLLCLFFTPIARSDEECSEAFERLIRQLEGVGMSDEVTDLHNLKEPSVEILPQPLDGQHGGKRWVLKRLDAAQGRWGSFSTITLKEVDPQGDPRWFIEMVGTEAAKFFGFEILSDKYMTIPDRAEFNGAVLKLNALLKELGASPIPLRFYDKPDIYRTVVAEYVRKFIDTGLPMAPGGNHNIHDVSFHTAAIFLPPLAVEILRAKLQYTHDFLDFLDRKYPKGPQQLAVRFLRFNLNKRFTARIDVATATLAPETLAFLKRPANAPSAPKDYLKSLKLFLEPDQAPHPQAELSRNLESLLSASIAAFHRLKAENVARHEKALPPEQLGKDLEEFSRNYASPVSSTFHPTKPIFSYFGSSTEEALEKLCLEVTQRREQIIKLIKSSPR